MSRKKLLHFIISLDNGGTEKMLLKVLPATQDRFEHRICCIKGHGSVGKELEQAGIKICYLDLKSGFSFKLIAGFRKIVREFNPDVLITYLIQADLIGRVLGRLFGIKKIICSIRANTLQSKYALFTIIDGLTSFLVTRYHFNSRTAAEVYRQFLLVPARKITVIPNGVDVEQFGDVEVNSQEKKAALGIPEGSIVLGCVARLTKQKGYRYSIEALARILNHRKNIILIIIGEGGERKNIESQIKSLRLEKEVFLLGNRADVPEWLTIMDIFVFPTLYEGMSNSLLEAMATGLPIVASDIPENKEIMENNKTGVLFPVKDVDKLTASIESLLNNPARALELGQEAKKKVQADYDIRRIREKLAHFWDTV